MFPSYLEILTMDNVHKPSDSVIHPHQKVTLQIGPEDQEGCRYFCVIGGSTIGVVFKCFFMFPIYLEIRAMDNAHKPSDSVTHQKVTLPIGPEDQGGCRYFCVIGGSIIGVVNS
jgi:hypothetical protein